MSSATETRPRAAANDPAGEEEEPHAERRCRHTNCGCIVTDDAPDGFCGAYCAAAQHEDQPPAGACACGHATCNASQEEHAGHNVENEVKISIGNGS